MTVHPRWLRYEQWTLLEAAQIVAGIEPFDYTVVGDDPHKILARIEDETARTVFDELYRQSKDGINTGSLAISEPSRTGKKGNIRVAPAIFLQWAQTREFLLRPGLAEHLATHNEENGAQPASAASTIGVTKGKIMGVFRVKPDPDANIQFWERKLGDPPQWLRKARISPGARRIPALWDPVMVAHVLLGRKVVGIKMLDRAIRDGFPNRWEQWEAETHDVDR